MIKKLSRIPGLTWQALFLVTGMSWLLAPALNHQLSYRITLISEYETAGQPYAWLFRAGDVIAAGLLLWLAWVYARHDRTRWTFWLLLAVGIGNLLDPIVTTSCERVVHGVCVEPNDLQALAHGVETIVTVVALAILTIRDVLHHRRLGSVLMVSLQIVFYVVFVTKFAKNEGFATFAQYIYQCAVMLWLAWFCREQYMVPRPPSLSRRVTAVRWLVALWAAINGAVAILTSLPGLHLVDRARSLYFAGDTAWLAQHGVIVGVIMLYLARHIVRGERRARQLLLIVLAVEVIRYALIGPHLIFLCVYGLTFAALFVARDDFERGAPPLTWSMRLRDLSYLLGLISMVLATTFALLDRDSHIASIAARSFDHFTDYAFDGTNLHKSHLESVLLAHTLTAFIGAALAAILWTLFRPSRPLSEGPQDSAEAEAVLRRYSTSTEDWFKLWPADKQYFWNMTHTAFVAYKITGPVAFALADPIGAPKQQKALLAAFVVWARGQGLRACFLPVFEERLPLYGALSSLQIGASALVNIDQFVVETSRDKWWRWKRNRAVKQGFTYHLSAAPHTPELLGQLHAVSDDWLTQGEHQERGFALGYFDLQYIRESTIHYLLDESGEVVAFVNQLPTVRRLSTASIDLLRFRASAQDAMPFLLANVISQLQTERYTHFDLGFVPFAGAQGPVIRITSTLGAGRFSAKGLEQFKNKFDPAWQPTYLAYDGDLADLALIALNLENAMALE
ncbi:MAG: hypothetical protein JWN38_108 [Candidatus Saccharibacteria bacterium]|nr:hypothetical protein [Candidatus Saccharibacteria bacterium]